MGGKADFALRPKIRSWMQQQVLAIPVFTPFQPASLHWFDCLLSLHPIGCFPEAVRCALCPKMDALRAEIPQQAKHPRSQSLSNEALVSATQSDSTRARSRGSDDARESPLRANPAWPIPVRQRRLLFSPLIMIPQSPSFATPAPLPPPAPGSPIRDASSHTLPINFPRRTHLQTTPTPPRPAHPAHPHRAPNRGGGRSGPRC